MPLVNLKDTPFKIRMISVYSASYGGKFIKMVPYFLKLLDALSLNIELDVNGKIDISLSYNPAKISFSYFTIKHIEHSDKNSISCPLLKTE